MTAKQFLRGVRDGLREIRMLEDNIARERDKLFHGSLELKQDLVQESVRRDRMAEVEARVQDLISTMEDRLKRLYEDREYAERIISELEDSKHRQVLTLYYLTTFESYEELGANKTPITGVYNPSWKDVAYKMGYNENYARIIHSSALEEFGRRAHL